MGSSFKKAFPGGSDSKELAYSVGNTGLTPRLENSPGERNSNPSSILAWEIPWTEESGRLQAMESQRAERSYSTFKVRRGSREEIPLVQGKEQWLHFAGAAVKRYPTSEVRETQVRR